MLPAAVRVLPGAYDPLRCRSEDGRPGPDCETVPCPGEAMGPFRPELSAVIEFPDPASPGAGFGEVCHAPLTAPPDATGDAEPIADPVGSAGAGVLDETAGSEPLPPDKLAGGENFGPAFGLGSEAT